MVAGTITRGAQDADVQSLFQRMRRHRAAEWQRSALLRGAEVALLGAAAPGTVGRGRAGGGGGGGGAAVRRARRAVSVAGPAGRRPFRVRARPDAATPRLRRGRGGRGAGVAVAAAAPACCVCTASRRWPALAASGGEPGRRATALLARIEWPGKPGAAAPIAPLSAAEQARFAAGQEVYKSVCQACHQPDGRGQNASPRRWSDPPWRSRQAAFRRGSCSTARRARSG